MKKVNTKFRWNAMPVDLDFIGTLKCNWQQDVIFSNLICHYGYQ
ncbi:MAG: hypothetical protein R2765_02920 [Ferruginibacter sp.]